MEKMKIEDNTSYKECCFKNSYPNLLEELHDKDIRDLYKDNFIIFPEEDNLTLNSDNIIFQHEYCKKDKNSKTTNCIRVGNFIGFLTCDEEKMVINSRFTSSGQNGKYFLIYLIQKVLSLNLTKSNINSFLQQPVNALPELLFPYYLNQALKKGLFKQYCTFKYNDLNVKGPIDFNRFFKEDVPFSGKITYSDRELSADNLLNELIRHTIEYLLNSKYGFLLNSEKLTRKNVNEIFKITPKYNFKKREQIIKYNLHHPLHQLYFKEYFTLQKLSLSILQHQGMNLDMGTSSIKGILFDVSWLWENYLAKILKNKVEHLDNHKDKDFISVYQNLYIQGDDQVCCPDFINKKRKIILDAKYKRYDDRKISLEDLRQITLYGYIFKSKKFGVIYPSLEETQKELVGKMKGYGAHVFRIAMKIPQECSNYEEFKEKFQKEEDKVSSLLDQI